MNDYTTSACKQPRRAVGTGASGAPEQPIVIYSNANFHTLRQIFTATHVAMSADMKSDNLQSVGRHCISLIEVLHISDFYQR